MQVKGLECATLDPYHFVSNLDGFFSCLQVHLK
jgi:hypothetical protein